MLWRAAKVLEKRYNSSHHSLSFPPTLLQVAYSYTYELRPYLDLLLQILLIEDSWQTHRCALPLSLAPSAGASLLSSLSLRSNVMPMLTDAASLSPSPPPQDPQRAEGHPRRQGRPLRHHPALQEPLSETGLPVHQVHGGAVQQLLRGLPDPAGALGVKWLEDVDGCM